MQTVTADFVRGKNVLLRLDLDVPIENGVITDTTRLEAGLDTLELCVENANCVVVMGHVGRPGGKVDETLSVKPIVEWFEEQYSDSELPEGMLHVLENLRFESGEDQADLNFAKELLAVVDADNSGNAVFVNDAFAAHHPSASTTVLPRLIPHAVGLHFAKEVETLMGIRNNPTRPLIAIIGGAKIEDKLPVVQLFANLADAVLVGGKLPSEIKEKDIRVPGNVLVAKMSEDGMDLSDEVIGAFANIIRSAKQVIWAGPMGKFEDGHQKGNKAIAEAIISCGANSIIGGGDTTAALKDLGLIDKFSFVSTGGGAMLDLLVKGTIPTIEALN